MHALLSLHSFVSTLNPFLVCLTNFRQFIINNIILKSKSIIIDIIIIYLYNYILYKVIKYKLNVR